jgi:UDP-2,3-diacylglucosamine hydrolase
MDALDRAGRPGISKQVDEPSTKPLLRYFIADLHLDGSDSARAKNFRSLLGRLADYEESYDCELYIIGDLFEFWYEYRSAIFDVYANDLAALEKAWQAGVKIYLFYGNRDFAYGKYVNRRFGATVLGDGQQILLSDSRPLWMEHGDLLCTADRRYLRFRKFIRSWPVKVAFFLMPWSIARGMIGKIRNSTNADKAKKEKGTIAIDLAFARRRLEEKKCRLLLCGHTHVAQQDDLGAGYRLIVLPPWCDTPAGMVDDGRSFKPFKLDDLQ